MVPARVSVHASLMLSDAIHEEMSFLRGNPYGIDFSCISGAALEQTRLVSLAEDEVTTTEFHLGTLDMRTVTRTPEVMTGKATPSEPATTYGIVAWFSAELTERIGFGTGPRDAPTHWQQVYFPFPEPFDVGPDRELTLSIWPPQGGEEDDGTWRWSISDGEQTLSVTERLPVHVTHQVAKATGQL